MAIFETHHEFIKSLQAANGLFFQHIIEKILAGRHDDFQTVPRTPGDGGLDGLSGQSTVAYCCYGLDLTSTKTSKEQKNKVIAKFKEDLNRLAEIEYVKKKPKQYQNKTLQGVLGKKAILKKIVLICNWFEDNSIIGTLNDHLDGLKLHSNLQCITKNCTLLIIGPKEIARDYSISSEVRLELTNPVLAKIMTDMQNEDVVRNTNIPSTSEFDSKFEALHNQNKSKKSVVDGLKNELLSDWKKQIAFTLKLEEDQPISARSVSKIISDATKHANKLTLSGRPAIEIMENLKQDLKLKIQNKFKDFSSEYTEEVADYIVASLVGVCPLDWR